MSFNNVGWTIILLIILVCHIYVFVAIKVALFVDVVKKNIQLICPMSVKVLIKRRKEIA